MSGLWNRPRPFEYLKPLNQNQLRRIYKTGEEVDKAVEDTEANLKLINPAGGQPEHQCEPSGGPEHQSMNSGDNPSVNP